MVQNKNTGKLTVSEHLTVREALAKIDKNRCGFVIVLATDGKVLGTLTDGDIRRAILSGKDNLDVTLSDSEIYSRDFTFLRDTQGVDDAIDIFKCGRIKFIPVLDENGRLANVLMKKQLYTLLLQCRNVSLSDDLSNVSDSLMDFEIFNRPWGVYKTTVLQDAYQAKVLQVKPGARLSLQYHNHREEYWTVSSGTGVAQVGGSHFILHPGSHVVIPRGCVHRLENTSDSEWLVVSEVQVGDYFGEDDIVRVQDDYGRAPQEEEKDA